MINGVNAVNLRTCAYFEDSNRVMSVSLSGHTLQAKRTIQLPAANTTLVEQLSQVERAEDKKAAWKTFAETFKKTTGYAIGGNTMYDDSIRVVFANKDSKLEFEVQGKNFIDALKQVAYDAQTLQGFEKQAVAIHKQYEEDVLMRLQQIKAKALNNKEVGKHLAKREKCKHNEISTMMRFNTFFSHDQVMHHAATDALVEFLKTTTEPEIARVQTIQALKLLAGYLPQENYTEINELIEIVDAG